MKAKIAKFTLLICGILIGLLLSCLILEVYLRFSNKFTLQPSNWGSFLNDHPYILSDDLLIGWENSPINNKGKYGIKKNNNVYRIIVLGDSLTVSGLYVHQLEDLLNHANLKYEFEVWNCAVAGYQITNYYGILRKRVLRFNPDMIIIGFCLNDFYAHPIVLKDGNTGKWLVFQDKIEGYCAYSAFAVNPKLFVKSYAYRFLVIFLQKLMKGNLGKNTNDSKISRWALGNIRDIAKKNNIKLLGVIIPYFKSKYGKNEQNEYEEAKRLLGEYKIKYLDLYGKFPNPDDLSWRENKDDYMHPSRKGHLIIGRQIYDYLLQDLDWWQ